jgi:hypothetical protein
LKRLRAVLGLVFGLAFAGSALGQTTTLAINGVSSNDNSASVNVAINTTMTITLTDTPQPNRTYGLFAAIANNAAPTGWFLAASGGGKKPFPITTGVATSIVETNYSTDIFPDRQSSPLIHLDATGKATLNFNIPSNANGQTFYFQAVVLKSGSTTQTDLSNAVTVNVGAPVTSARMVVSVATAGTPPTDHALFGILSFNNGDPTSANFVPDGTFLDIKVDNINLSDIHPWALHSLNGASGTARRPRDFEWASGTVPALNNDNWDYGRIELPPVTGGVPARSLMRCYDNVSQEGFFMVVNKAPNPNTPGVDYFAVGRKKDTVNPSSNSWQPSLAFSPDGTRMAAFFDFSFTDSTPSQMFLLATDGTKPFTDSGGNATDTIEVTPPGINRVWPKAMVFTSNRLWFTIDTSSSGPRSLWTVNIRSSTPTSQLVAIPVNQNYGTSHVVDYILEKSLVVKRSGGSTLCFAAGDIFTPGSGVSPDLVTFGDWYAVTEAKPTSAVNVTGFPTYGSGTSVQVYNAGETNNGQSGYASLSPDESALAIIVNHSNETSTVAADEVYIYRTTDSNGDGLGDDAGSSTFTNPITRNSNINSTGDSNQFKRGGDLFLADASHLYFWYGAWASTVDRQADLYYWDGTKQALSNLTKTSGQTAPPFNHKGNIYPEGYFPSPNGKYLIFSRSSNAAGFARSNQANLVALDVTNAALVNVTGDEWPGTKNSNTDNTNVTFGENFDWHLSYTGGQFPSLVYCAAPLTGSSTNPKQVWVFDANFPTAALKLTAETLAAETAESVTGSPYNLGCAWAFCNNGNTTTADESYQDLLYFFRDDLTQSGKTAICALGQFTWLRPGTQADSTGVSPPALLTVIGATGGGAENPSNGKFYFFSINGTTDYNYKGTTGVDAPGHQVGTTTGFLQIWAVNKP